MGKRSSHQVLRMFFYLKVIKIEVTFLHGVTGDPVAMIGLNNAVEEVTEEYV